MERKSRCFFGFSVLAVALCLLFFFNLVSGSADFSVSEIIEILSGKNGDISGKKIIFGIRLPRMVSALVLGGALSVSGFLLQTFFANPIAGPFILGISSGAKLATAVVMIFFLGRGIVLNSVSLVISAFVGSLVSMGFILLISWRVKKMSALVISGVMTGYICSAVTDIVVTFADDSNIVNLHNWSMGTFSGTDWDDVKVIAVICSLSLAWAFMLSKPMGAYQMGEAYAQSMGVNIRLFRAELILLSSLLSACVTAFAGPVSFVGIAVPHLVKSLFNTAKPIIIIPASFMGGAVFCLFCDLLARSLFSPVELSISSVTAVFGAPVVIWIMLKKHQGRA